MCVCVDFFIILLHICYYYIYEKVFTMDRCNNTHSQCLFFFYLLSHDQAITLHNYLYISIYIYDEFLLRKITRKLIK